MWGFVLETNRNVLIIDYYLVFCDLASSGIEEALAWGYNKRLYTRYWCGGQVVMHWISRIIEAAILPSRYDYDSDGF